MPPSAGTTQGDALAPIEEPAARTATPRLPVRPGQAGALLVLCLLLRVVSLVRPCLSDDEATYAVVAREMLAGQALYRDVVDHKPPAIYLVNAATQALGGPVGGMALLHVLLIAIVWATGLIVAAIARRYSPVTRDGPVLAAVMWIVFTTTLVDTDSLAANCELLMMLPLVASFAVFLKASEGAGGQLRGMFGAGVLVGIAMLFKYQAGVQLPVYACAWLVLRHRAARSLVPGLAALAVGVAPPIAGAALWLASLDALPSGWFWFRFNFSYISAGSRTTMLEHMVVRGGFVIVAAAPLYAFAARAVRRRSDCLPATHWLVLGWLAVSAAAVMVGGRFFGHYFHQLTAPLAVLAGPAIAGRWARRRGLVVAMLAIPAGAFLVLGAAHDRLMRMAGQPDPDYASVVAWLDASAPRSEAICIWGNSPVLYFEAERPLGCRFVFANYLTGLSPATATQTDPVVDASMNIVPEAWDMLEVDLATRRPMFILDGSPGNVDFYGKWPPDRFPRLASILARDYRAVAEVAGMRIFRRHARP